MNVLIVSTCLWSNPHFKIVLKNENVGLTRMIEIDVVIMDTQGENSYC